MAIAEDGQAPHLRRLRGVAAAEGTAAHGQGQQGVTGDGLKILWLTNGKMEVLMGKSTIIWV
jgi:hypothetical protein